MKQCKWCDKPFKSKISYQIYCSTECRDSATKEKIAERHKVLKRKNRKKKTRLCAGGCGVRLSIYNDNNICESCFISKRNWDKVMKELRSLSHEYEDRTK